MITTPDPIPFDPDLLLTTLRTELRAAWARLQSDHGAEGLYGFGIYTTSELSYLNVTAFSNAGLDKVTERYVTATEHFKGKDRTLIHESLRWSPCDSPLHEIGCEMLPETAKLIQCLDPALEENQELSGDDEDDDDFDDEWWDPRVLKSFDLCIQALQEMDAEGLFGTGEMRESFVLCLWKGDQSNIERYEHAKKLNPASVTKRFGEQLNAGIRAHYKAMYPGKRPPKNDVFE